MYGVPIELPAVEKARWLAEVAEALVQAGDLLRSLELRSEQWEDARDLFHKIEAARVEVHALQLSRSLRPREENDPERIESRAWERPA
jgi:hypothetical protein